MGRLLLESRQKTRTVASLASLAVNASSGAIPKTRKGRQRRAELLECAARAFAVQGYRKVSLASVASQVGITEQGAMHYFPAKEHLLVGVLDAYDLADEEGYREVSASAPTMVDALIASMRHRLTSQHQTATLISVIMAESVDPEHAAHDWFIERNRRMRESVAGILTVAQDRGELRADLDIPTLAAQQVAMFDGLVVQWTLDPDAFDVMDVFEHFYASLRA